MGQGSLLDLDFKGQMVLYNQYNNIFLDFCIFYLLPLYS